MRKQIMLIQLSLVLSTPLVWSGTIPVSINPDDCGELIESADNYASAVREAGKKSADTITKGDKDLKEESCFAKYADLDFDLNFQVPSMQTGIVKAGKKAAEMAWERIKEEGCAIADEADAAVKQAMSCNAAVGVNIDAGVDRDSVEFGSCLGAGDAPNYQFNESLGDGSIRSGAELDDGASGSATLFSEDGTEGSDTTWWQ